MKAHSRTKDRPTLPRPQEAPNADRILNRIRTVTRELEDLQAEIHHRVTQGTEPSQSGSDDSSRARLLGEFKITLDRLRRVLWSYLDQVTSQPVAGVKHELQEPIPLHRVHYSQSTPAVASGAPSGSFFDRLDVVIDAYMKNTATRGESGPRKRAKN
jgi:hypothetical protein